MTEAEIESMKADICRAIDMTPLSFSYDQAIEYLKKAIPGIIDEYKRCKDECKKEAEDKGLVMSDEECKPCEYLYVCPYMMAEMNDIVEGN